MARIEVTEPRFEGSWRGRKFEAERITDGPWADLGWRVQNPPAVFLISEVRVLGRHEGEYDPNHWGELNPDAYDRLGYLNPHDGTEDDYQPHGRHLLHTGVE